MSVETMSAVIQRVSRLCLVLAAMGLISGCTFYVGGKDAGTRDGEASYVPATAMEVC